MKDRAIKLFGVFAILATLLTISCTNDLSTMDADEIEQEIFDEWMAKHHSDLLSSYQEDGGYYIDLVTVGDATSRPIGDTICWVEYDLTGYDLYGNVSVTRNSLVAWQQGTFTLYTHYVPYYRFSYNDVDEEDYYDYDPLLECTQLAFSNELTIDGESGVKLYNGAEFTLYAPSSVTTSEGTTGTGGYEGQFALSTLPFVCKVKVIDVVYDTAEFDQDLVNAFALSNGGLTITPESLDYTGDDDDDDDSDDEDDDDEDDEYEDALEAEEEKYADDTNIWRNATATVPNVYLNRTYSPNMEGVSFNYINPYTTTVPDSPYSEGMAALDKRINIALEKFTSDDYDDQCGYVGDDGTATVWYICRLLDGFIVDTNIGPVMDIIYDTTNSTGTAISYSVDSDESSYISAWYYSIPNMKYGRWGAVLTSSTFAYGSAGVNGDTSTSSSSSSSSYYDYYNYYSSYSNNYYNSYYGSYYDSSYYSNYYNTSSTTTTTTTVSTEILPFAPLLFQIYIQAYDEDDE